VLLVHLNSLRAGLVVLEGSNSRAGRAFQKFAEPWMAEQKRHMDVP